MTNYLNVAHCMLRGDIYNGSGYYGQTATGVEVNLGQDAVYCGAVAQTETIHIDATQYPSTVLPEGTSAQEAGQITSFTIAEYYDIGHVGNRFYAHEGNTLVMNLADNAVWNVTGDCLLSGLTIGDAAVLQGEDGEISMTVDGQETEIVPGTYEGEIRITYTANPVQEEAAPAEDATVVEDDFPPDSISAGEEFFAQQDTAEASSAQDAEVSAEEQEAPAEETAEQTSRNPLGWIIGIAAVVAVLAGGGAVLHHRKKKQGNT